MKLKSFIACFFLSMSLISCIQDEAPNAEADILTCLVPDSILVGNIQVSNNKVIVTVIDSIFQNDNYMRTKLAPLFTLTDGATVTPASGSTINFGTSLSYSTTYVVTSEDKQWEKRYEVSFVPPSYPTKYDFEYVELGDKNLYQVFYEAIPIEGTNERYPRYIWASGNPGFALTGMGSSPEAYPTTSTINGFTNKGVKLETKSTGFFGSLKGMPIAAGNLFIGSFDTPNALKDALAATRFGLPFKNKPIKFSFYYKFKAGPVFTNKQQQVIPGKIDACDVYSVLYETDADLKSLDGANVLTHENIVAIARIENPGEPSDWTRCDINFTYKKSFDTDKAKAYKYNLAVVFSSSVEGAYFNGAVGSTLYIDDAEITYEEIN